MGDFLPACKFIPRTAQQGALGSQHAEETQNHRVIQGVLERSLLGWMTKKVDIIPVNLKEDEHPI